MKRARSRTPSPLPALQPLSFSPLREFSRSPTPLERQCKWMRHGIRRSNSRTNNINNSKVVQNEDKELMLALQRLHDKLQVSEPAYYDEDVAIIPFPSESNSSLSRSPHRTSESEDALSSSIIDNNTESNNGSPSKNFITNQVYEFTGSGNVSTVEGTTRNGKLCESKLKSTRRNVNHGKVNNVCSVTSSLLLTSVNLLDASQITRHRQTATNVLNMIKQAYALVTIECAQKESIREKITVKDEEELDSVNKNNEECLQSSRMVCSSVEEIIEQQERSKENWHAYLPLCLQQETYQINSYASWLVCKLHDCVQSLLVYANASLPLRFAISSDTRVLLMLCDIGSCAFQFANKHQNCINTNINSMNGFNHNSFIRNVQVELEQLRVHWIECGLSSRLLNYLEQAYVLEFLLDAALPPAVCSTRYEGMHTALLNTKQKIINEFATNRTTNNLLTNIDSNNNNSNVSTGAANNIPAIKKNSITTNNNRAVSVSLTRVCKCFPLRALCALVTMSAFADVKVRVRLLDKLTSEGLLERILQEMHRATDELHMLIMEEENKSNRCKAQHTEQVHTVKKDNLTFSQQDNSTPKNVESKEGKANIIKNKKVMESKYQHDSKNISHCRSQSVLLEHDRCNKEQTDCNDKNVKNENEYLFTTLNNIESTQRHVAHSLSPRPKLHSHSLLANKETKENKFCRSSNEKGFYKEKDSNSNTEKLENNTHYASTLSAQLSRQPLSQIHEQIGNCVDVLLLLSCANLRPACEADELASNAKTASMAVVRPCEWLTHMAEIKAIVHTMVHVLTLYSSLPVTLQSSGGGSSEISQIVYCLHQMLNVNECVAKVVEHEVDELIAHRQEHDNTLDSNKTKK